jgi:predicted thioesterase
MTPLLEPGLGTTSTVTVTAEMSPPHLAPTVVLSTPMMIQLMEQASLDAVQPHLGAARTSVGTHVNVSHESAAHEGEEITVASLLTAVDGRRLTFDVTVTAGRRTIGRGSHSRFVVDRDRFSR